MPRNESIHKKDLSSQNIYPISVYASISINDFALDDIVCLHGLFTRMKCFQPDIRLYDSRSGGKSGSLYSFSVLFLVSLTWAAKKVLSPTLELIGKKLAKAVDRVLFKNKKKKRTCDINIRISIDQNFFDIYLEPKDVLHGIPERKRLIELLSSEHNKQKVLTKHRSPAKYIVYNSKQKKWEFEGS